MLAGNASMYVWFVPLLHDRKKFPALPRRHDLRNRYLTLDLSGYWQLSGINFSQPKLAFSCVAAEKISPSNLCKYKLHSALFLRVLLPATLPNLAQGGPSHMPSHCTAWLLTDLASR